MKLFKNQEKNYSVSQNVRTENRGNILKDIKE